MVTDTQSADSDQISHMKTKNVVSKIDYLQKLRRNRNLKVPIQRPKLVQRKSNDIWWLHGTTLEFILGNDFFFFQNGASNCEQNFTLHDFHLGAD